MDNLGFLLYLDRCYYQQLSTLHSFSSLCSYCYRDPAGIWWDFSMSTFLFSVCLWMASAEKFQILRWKCLTPPKLPLYLNGFSLLQYHSCDTSKLVAGVAGHAFPNQPQWRKAICSDRFHILRCHFHERLG